MAKRILALEADLSDAVAGLDAMAAAARKVTGSDDEDPEDLARQLLAEVDGLRERDDLTVDLWATEQRVKDLADENATLRAILASVPAPEDDEP